MLIQSTIAGAKPVLHNTEWEFKEDRAGRHICEVTDERAIHMLLARSDVYFEAAPLDPVRPPKAMFEKRKPADPIAKAIAEIETTATAIAPSTFQTPAGAAKAAADTTGQTEQPMTEDEAAAMFEAMSTDKLAEQSAAEHQVAASALDPDNEFPMNPGEAVNTAAIGRVVDVDPAAPTQGATVEQIADAEATKPSAEDPRITNAQAAAKRRAMKKKQSKPVRRK